MLNYREVEEKIKTLEKENEALMNRCFTLTRGATCFFCGMKMKCKHWNPEVNQNDNSEQS